MSAPDHVDNPLKLIPEVATEGNTQPDLEHPPEDGWKHTGVQVVAGDQLDRKSPNEGQMATQGMIRAVAIDKARNGAQKLWAGTVNIAANAATGAHHHGHLESVIYVVKGRARMKWGNRLEFTAEAGPGDFIYVPPYVPHQEINALKDEELECVLVRSDSTAVAVGITIADVDAHPTTVKWIDPTHANLAHDGDGGHSHDHEHEHGHSH